VKKTKKGYELVLDLNEAYPRSLLGKKAIEKFVLILYNPEFRSLWKSIQRQMRGDTYDFSFLSMSFKRIDLQLKTKNIDSIQLVYFISAILSKISFPARSVIINHPLLKKHKGSNSKSYINESEKNRASYKIPISKDNEESQGPSNNTFEEVSVLKLEYSFDKEITIQKNKLNNDDDKDGEPNPFAYFSIEDKLLSLNQEKDAKGDRFMALTRDHIENKFDQAQIPRGLVFFTKVVEMFTSKLSINFSYNVFEFEGDYSFHMIAGEKRKGIIVELGNAEPVYIIEVDSSDDRYISTLLLTNLRTKKINSLLGLILSELSKSQGTWSKNTLDVYSDYKIVRHPRRSKEFTKQSVNESGDTNPYIKRFANRLIGLLT
jgi:hypothetical protein